MLDVTYCTRHYWVVKGLIQVFLYDVIENSNFLANLIHGGYEVQAVIISYLL